MPRLRALAPDLTVLEIEDVDTDDQSKEHNDFVEDFVDIRRVKKKREEFCSPLNDPARS